MVITGGFDPPNLGSNPGRTYILNTGRKKQKQKRGESMVLFSHVFPSFLIFSYLFLSFPIFSHLFNRENKNNIKKFFLVFLYVGKWKKKEKNHTSTILILLFCPSPSILKEKWKRRQKKDLGMMKRKSTFLEKDYYDIQWLSFHRISGMAMLIRRPNGLA